MKSNGSGTGPGDGNGNVNTHVYIVQIPLYMNIQMCIVGHVQTRMRREVSITGCIPVASFSPFCSDSSLSIQPKC